jgi:hypothetical protein
MADDTKQNQDTDQTDDDATEDERAETTREDKGGDDTPTKLLKALQAERDARAEAERKVKAFERKQRDAEAERALKAGDLEAVIKTKDADLAERDARIAELEGEIAAARLETARERVAAKHKLPPQLAARLRGTDEASLDADAKELAKLIVVRAPDTEAGKGANGAAPKHGVEELKQGMVKTGRYAF